MWLVTHHLQTRDQWLWMERLCIGETMDRLSLEKQKDPLTGAIACGDRGLKTIAGIPFTADYLIKSISEDRMVFYF